LSTLGNSVGLDSRLDRPHHEWNYDAAICHPSYLS
jgi:hypothetical protein